MGGWVRDGTNHSASAAVHPEVTEEDSPNTRPDGENVTSNYVKNVKGDIKLYVPKTADVF